MRPAFGGAIAGYAVRTTPIGVPSDEPVRRQWAYACVRMFTWIKPALQYTHFFPPIFGHAARRTRPLPAAAAASCTPLSTCTTRVVIYILLRGAVHGWNRTPMGLTRPEERKRRMRRGMRRRRTGKGNWQDATCIFTANRR